MSSRQQTQAPFQQQAQSQPAAVSVEDMDAEFQACIDQRQARRDQKDAPFNNLLEMFNTYKLQQAQQAQQLQLQLLNTLDQQNETQMLLEEAQEIAKGSEGRTYRCLGSIRIEASKASCIKHLLHHQASLAAATQGGHGSALSVKKY